MVEGNPEGRFRLCIRDCSENYSNQRCKCRDKDRTESNTDGNGRSFGIQQQQAENSIHRRHVSIRTERSGTKRMEKVDGQRDRNDSGTAGPTHRAATTPKKYGRWRWRFRGRFRANANANANDCERIRRNPCLRSTRARLFPASHRCPSSGAAAGAAATNRATDGNDRECTSLDPPTSWTVCNDHGIGTPACICQRSSRLERWDAGQWIGQRPRPVVEALSPSVRYCSPARWICHVRSLFRRR
mmetsp:Transcript_21100/g.58699  ORF Transcript_21100/g.58699 Transcript_21100/m.58699 type:complete len:243 (+) Transcript_21100:353-1081(+)